MIEIVETGTANIVTENGRTGTAGMIVTAVTIATAEMTATDGTTGTAGMIEIAGTIGAEAEETETAR